MTRAAAARLVALAALTDVLHPGQAVALARTQPAASTLGAVVAAGGGLANFSATVILEWLGGDDAGASLTPLVTAGGAERVKRSLTIIEFAVPDAVEHLRAAGYSVHVPALDELDASTLLKTLDRLGRRSGAAHFSADLLLDALLTPVVYRGLRARVDAHFGPGSAVAATMAIAAVMTELADR